MKTHLENMNGLDSLGAAFLYKKPERAGRSGVVGLFRGIHLS